MRGSTENPQTSHGGKIDVNQYRGEAASSQILNILTEMSDRNFSKFC